MAGESCVNASTKHTSGGPQRFVRLDKAPKSWLRLLVDRRDDSSKLLDEKSLQNLMAASWAVCEAVLSCMGKRRLVVMVRPADVMVLTF